MREQWRPVVGYEGLYEVSDFGNVRSLHKSKKPRLRGDLLTPALTGGTTPRLCVALYRDGTKRTRLVHQLVLEAFAGRRPPGLDALHGPGGPLDNRAVNLYWGTRQQNYLDSVRDGTAVRGERTITAKLTQADVLACRARYAAGEAQWALASEFGVSRPSMSNAITGRNWGWLPGAVPIDHSRHGRKGAAHHSAKLVPALVTEIRRRYAAGERQPALASEFGVSQPVISAIITRRTWRHIA